MKDYSEHFTSHYGFMEEWHRGNLPHRNKKGLIQFITYRLADSLSQDVLRHIHMEIKPLEKELRDVEIRKKYQYWLDKGLGSCALSKHQMAQNVMDTFNHHDGVKYELLSWTIMPNHVHVLIYCIEDVSRVVQSWKSYTGKWGLANNKLLDLGLGVDATIFWKSEYWDRFIRDEEHFNNTVRYILNNPYKAKLPEDHVAYLFTGVKRGLPGSRKHQLLV